MSGLGYPCPYLERGTPLLEKWGNPNRKGWYTPQSGMMLSPLPKSATCVYPPPPASVDRHIPVKILPSPFLLMQAVKNTMFIYRFSVYKEYLNVQLLMTN